MTELVRRKRRLVLETPYRIRGRAVIVHVEAAGLRIREKGCRAGTLEITWAAKSHIRAHEDPVSTNKRQSHSLIMRVAQADGEPASLDLRFEVQDSE